MKMLKNLSELSGVKKLSKEELKSTNGGIIFPCADYATYHTVVDAKDGGYSDDEVTMSTVYTQHFRDCMSQMGL